MTGRQKGNPRQDLIKQGASASSQPTPEETETSILADKGYLNILTSLCEVMLKSAFYTGDFSMPTLCWAPSHATKVALAQGASGTATPQAAGPASYQHCSVTCSTCWPVAASCPRLLAICPITGNKRHLAIFLAISLWFTLVKHKKSEQRQDIIRGISYHLSLL